MVKIGFEEGLSDSSLFVYNCNGIQTYLLVYVDDIVITSSSNSNIKEIISQLSTDFCIKDLGDLKFFLDIHVARSKEGLFLSKQQYVANLLTDENLQNLKPVSTPMEPKADLTQSNTPVLGRDETTRYRRILRSLQYLTTMRPDISFTVIKLSQIFTTPTTTHWQALQRVLRYISCNPFLGLLIRPTSSTTITVFSDADWAWDTLDK